MNFLIRYPSIGKNHDFILIDITYIARLAGINKRTSMTRSAFDFIAEDENNKQLKRSFTDRLRDVSLLLFLSMASQNKPVAEIYFQIALWKNGHSTNVTLKTVFSLEPNGEVHLIIMLPEE